MIQTEFRFVQAELKKPKYFAPPGRHTRTMFLPEIPLDISYALMTFKLSQSYKGKYSSQYYRKPTPGDYVVLDQDGSACTPIELGKRPIIGKAIEVNDDTVTVVLDGYNHG